MILKVKQWKNAQFTQLDSETIHLHKCNRYITLFSFYKALGFPAGSRLVFIEGKEDKIHIQLEVWDIVGTTLARGTIQADEIFYLDSIGKYRLGNLHLKQ